MRVTAFAFVGHPVANLRKARTFYEEVLQLPPPIALSGDLDGDRGFLEYQIGSSTLAITTDWSDGQPPEFPSAGLVLEVDDFPEAIQHITDCGIPFDLGPFDWPTCSLAVISDPDGNKIGLHKLNKQS